jgi:hypothetical protein
MAKRISPIRIGADAGSAFASGPSAEPEKARTCPWHYRVILPILFIFFSISLAVPSPAFPSTAECLNCHGDRGLEKVDAKGVKISLFVDLREHKGSVHKDLDCTACHPRAEEVPHPKMSGVNCVQCHEESIAQELKKSVHGGGDSSQVKLSCAHCHGRHDIKRAAEDHFFPCQNCHTKAAIQFNNSVHKKATQAGKLEAASCQDCHGGHNIRKVTSKESSVYPMNLPRTCAQCHGSAKQATKKSFPHRDMVDLYMDTVHGRALDRGGLLVAAVCTSCHGSHEIRSHLDPASSTYRQNIPRTCGKCHAGVEASYEESIHGKWLRRGNPQAPSCTDCHTSHEIRRVDTYKWKLSVVQECGTCHEQSLKTFRDTFHGQVNVLGYASSARCSDCHGYHDVLPSRDPQSRTHPSHLLATCQKCHPKATEGFTRYYPHADPSKKERYPILHRTFIFMSAILIVTFGFFGLHTILWLPRSLRERLNRAKRRQDGDATPGGDDKNRRDGGGSSPGAKNSKERET